MSHIITTSHVQQNIGKISQAISSQCFIVTNRGEGRIVMLPYFEGCDEKIMEYMEDYQMVMNKGKLQKRYKKSSASGKSSLSI